MRRLALGVLVVSICLVGTLAIPVELWRTGRLSLPPLVLAPPDASPVSGRLWIDTDAACGHAPRTDVDDCLTVWLLARSPGVNVTGISTVFGNAPLDVTDHVTRELVDRLPLRDRAAPLVVHRGARDATSGESATPAHEALVRALSAGPLTIVALGPLTNVAHTLDSRPDLRRHVATLVAVMGRRMGHLFHPSEGAGRGTLLGHGPVFRDFNFTTDRAAVSRLMGMDVPLTLIPYDAARHVEITAADLHRLAAHDDAGAWIADRARGWLEYWRTDIGRSGFYPFDLMAAAYVLAPSVFRCATVRAWVGTDPLLFLPLFRQEALLVDTEGRSSRHRAASYCPSVEAAFPSRLKSWLAGAIANGAASAPLAALSRARHSNQLESPRRMTHRRSTLEGMDATRVR